MRDLTHHFANKESKFTASVAQITLCASKKVLVLTGQIDTVEAGDVTQFSSATLGDGALAELRDLANGKRDPQTDVEREFVTLWNDMDFVVRSVAFNSLNVVATMDAKGIHANAVPTFVLPDLEKLGYSAEEVKTVQDGYEILKSERLFPGITAEFWAKANNAIASMKLRASHSVPASDFAAVSPQRTQVPRASDTLSQATQMRHHVNNINFKAEQQKSQYFNDHPLMKLAQAEHPDVEKIFDENLDKVKDMDDVDVGKLLDETEKVKKAGRHMSVNPISKEPSSFALRSGVKFEELPDRLAEYWRAYNQTNQGCGRPLLALLRSLLDLAYLRTQGDFLYVVEPAVAACKLLKLYVIAARNMSRTKPTDNDLMHDDLVSNLLGESSVGLLTEAELVQLLTNYGFTASNAKAAIKRSHEGPDVSDKKEPSRKADPNDPSTRRQMSDANSRLQKVETALSDTNAEIAALKAHSSEILAVLHDLKAEKAKEPATRNNRAPAPKKSAPASTTPADAAPAEYKPEVPQ